MTTATITPTVPTASTVSTVSTAPGLPAVPAVPVLPVDLTDATFWTRPDHPELVDALRAAGPVQRMETAEEGTVWSVLSYQHAAQVLTDARTFSSTGGSLLGSGVGRTPAGSGKMMALSDPPRHREYRAPLASAFHHRQVAGSVERIRQVARWSVDRALERGDVDLVEIVESVPLVVLCDLFDIAEAERDTVIRTCDQAFLGRTPEERREGHQALLPFLFGKAIERRTNPGEDLVSRLATHRTNGSYLPLEEVVLNLDNIIVGGVQTVRHTAAMSLLGLLRHPDCWQALRRGEVELGSAVDELLRWTSVGLHVLRTATARVELGGQTIEPGERVVVWTWAANHDAEHFDRPHEIVLDRSPNRHLALGVGPHFCIGAGLAKTELVEILRAVLDRVERIELLAEPLFNHSVINFGVDRCPVRLHRSVEVPNG